VSSFSLQQSTIKERTSTTTNESDATAKMAEMAAVGDKRRKSRGKRSHTL
jgi:hypothetical protein